MNTAKQVIRNAIDAGLISQYADDYVEPGYSIGDKIGILFANWNPRKWDSDATKDDRIMPRLAEVAERAGYECEWSDEWATCDCCYRAVRTSPDSYGWRPSYWQDDCEIMCADCVNPVEYLEWLEGKSDCANTFAHIDPTEHGYVLLKEGMEHGWHPGQNDSPAVVAKALRGMGVERFLFAIDSVGQFDLSFSVYVHSDDYRVSALGTVASALSYDPGTEMGKALRGEPSDVYRMETREITPEKFVSGSWTKGE